jgi:hypothetical protein
MTRAKTPPPAGVKPECDQVKRKNMGKSKPFDLISLLRSIWESHETNAGRKYGSGTRDLRSAKMWLEVNAFPAEDVTDLVARFDRFTKSPYWLERGLPLYGFLDAYADFDAPREKVSVVVEETEVKICGECGTRWVRRKKDWEWHQCPKCEPNVLKLVAQRKAM